MTSTPAGHTTRTQDAPLVRVVIDADCPGCGYPERSLDIETGKFHCSGMNPDRCDYVSTERDEDPEYSEFDDPPYIARRRAREHAVARDRIGAFLDSYEDEGVSGGIARTFLGGDPAQPCDLTVADLRAILAGGA